MSKLSRDEMQPDVSSARHSKRNWYAIVAHKCVTHKIPFNKFKRNPLLLAFYDTNFRQWLYTFTNYHRDFNWFGQTVNWQGLLSKLSERQKTSLLENVTLETHGTNFMENNEPAHTREETSDQLTTSNMPTLDDDEYDIIMEEIDISDLPSTTTSSTNVPTTTSTTSTESSGRAQTPERSSAVPQTSAALTPEKSPRKRLGSENTPLHSKVQIISSTPQSSTESGNQANTGGAVQGESGTRKPQKTFKLHSNEELKSDNDKRDEYFKSQGLKRNRAVSELDDIDGIGDDRATSKYFKPTNDTSKLEQAVTDTETDEEEVPDCSI